MRSKKAIAPLIILILVVAGIFVAYNSGLLNTGSIVTTPGSKTQNEGQSCGYKSDGGPFCKDGLACNNFQCVKTGNPKCTTLGGTYCYTGRCSGNYENSEEGGWCCLNGKCINEDPSKCGLNSDSCIFTSDCCGGYRCKSFKCIYIPPENPQNSNTCTSQGGAYCGDGEYCSSNGYVASNEGLRCCINSGKCTIYKKEGESCSGKVFDECGINSYCINNKCTRCRSENFKFCENPDDKFYFVCLKGNFNSINPVQKPCDTGSVCQDSKTMTVSDKCIGEQCSCLFRIPYSSICGMPDFVCLFKKQVYNFWLTYRVYIIIAIIILLLIILLPYIKIILMMFGR